MKFRCGDPDCNGSHGDGDCNDNYSPRGVEGDLTRTEKEEFVSSGSVNQIGPEVVETSENLHTDSGKAEVLVAKGAWSNEKSEPEVDLTPKIAAQ